ncbi:MAG: hypothetical protein GKS04_01590 [Candidatus Mycalebacterium zealandia]|nr:MAG: hypothetical protein GKS04_01590 [Candidatus Mycalebacterium zealandia]
MFNLKTKLNIARGFITKNRPFYIQYYILSRCNLNCRQCNIVEANSDLQTAGFQTTREQFELCREVGAKDINISLDSLIPAKQECINGGIPNSWHRAIECIMDCNEIFDPPTRRPATRP